MIKHITTQKVSELARQCEVIPRLIGHSKAAYFTHLEALCNAAIQHYIDSKLYFVAHPNDPALDEVPNGITVILQRKIKSFSDLPTETMYYLQDSRSYVGNCPMWWGLGGNGYTSDLRKAQKYTLKEAMQLHNTRDEHCDIPWACNEVDALRRPTVDAQDLPRRISHQVENIVAAAKEQGIT